MLLDEITFRYWKPLLLLLEGISSCCCRILFPLLKDVFPLIRREFFLLLDGNSSWYRSKLSSVIAEDNSFSYWRIILPVIGGQFFHLLRDISSVIGGQFFLLLEGIYFSCWGIFFCYWRAFLSVVVG